MAKRLALIGVGKWGANYLRTIVGSNQDKLTLIVSTKSREQLDAIAVSGAKIQPDISSLDQFSDKLDGAIVATPPDVRPLIIESLTRLGIPVLAEKPLSLDADTSITLFEQAQQLDVPLVEGYIHLYSWPYLRLLEQLGSGWPCFIESAGCGWGPFRDYSPLEDYGPHDLAMALGIFNRMPEKISLSINDVESSLAFSSDIALDFGDRGQAAITVSNVSSDKVRRFSVRQNSKTWVYDDCIPDKLVCNGVPQSSPLQETSAMQLMLDSFCERKQQYDLDRLGWLSKSVAQILQCLEIKRANIMEDINDGRQHVPA